MSKSINLFVGGELVELFDFESVTLKRVIKDVSDPSKLFTDYSNSFEVPASRVNNRIFKHYYRADITDGVDGRALLDAELRVDFISYKKGNVEVRAVNMRDGKPYSYEIVFYGKLTELSKKIGNDELSALDLAQFDHSNDITSVRDRLADAGTDNLDLIYPLISRKRRFIKDTSNVIAGDHDNLANINYLTSTRDDENYGVEKKDLVPALKVGRLIEAIEDRYNITFEGAIQNKTIKHLYMLLHKPLTEIDTIFNSTLTGMTGFAGMGDYGLNLDSTGTYLNISKLGGVEYSSKRITFTITTSSPEYSMRIMSKNSGLLMQMTQDNPTTQIKFSDISDEIYLVVSGDNSSVFNVDLAVETYLDLNIYGGGSLQTQYSAKGSITAAYTAESSFVVSNNIPTVKVIDFLSDLFKRFNIVAEFKGGVLKTYHYDYFMYKGNTVDVTQYISQDNMRIERPNQYSSIDFGFRDLDTSISQAYESVNSKAYGELKYRLENEDGSKLVGDTYNVSLMSNQIPLENLDGVSGGLTYATLGDAEGKEQKTSLTYFYAYVDTDVNLAFDNGSSVEEITRVMLPSNMRRNGLDTGFYNSLAFSEEVEEHSVDNYFGTGCFNMFYGTLVSQMFATNRRIYKVDANLPLPILHNLSMNDRLVISGRQYLINSIQTNFTTMESSLVLVNIQQSSLGDYSLVCSDWVNTSATESASIVYMKEDGDIEYLQINAGESVNVCAIGQPFHISSNLSGEAVVTSDGGEGGVGSTSGGTYSAILTVSNNIPNTTVQFTPSSTVSGLPDGQAFSITATLVANAGHEILNSTYGGSYTFSGVISGSNAIRSVAFNGNSGLASSPDTLTASMSLEVGAYQPVSGMELHIKGVAEGGVSPYVSHEWKWRNATLLENTYYTIPTQYTQYFYGGSDSTGIWFPSWELTDDYDVIYEVTDTAGTVATSTPQRIAPLTQNFTFQWNPPVITTGQAATRVKSQAILAPNNFTAKFKRARYTVGTANTTSGVDGGWLLGVEDINGSDILSGWQGTKDIYFRLEAFGTWETDVYREVQVDYELFDETGTTQYPLDNPNTYYTVTIRQEKDARILALVDGDSFMNPTLGYYGGAVNVDLTITPIDYSWEQLDINWGGLTPWFNANNETGFGSDSVSISVYPQVAGQEVDRNALIQWRLVDADGDAVLNTEGSEIVSNAVHIFQTQVTESEFFLQEENMRFNGDGNVYVQDYSTDATSATVQLRIEPNTDTWTSATSYQAGGIGWLTVSPSSGTGTTGVVFSVAGGTGGGVATTVFTNQDGDTETIVIHRDTPTSSGAGSSSGGTTGGTTSGTTASTTSGGGGTTYSLWDAGGFKLKYNSSYAVGNFVTASNGQSYTLTGTDTTTDLLYWNGRPHITGYAGATTTTGGGGGTTASTTSGSNTNVEPYTCQFHGSQWATATYNSTTGAVSVAPYFTGQTVTSYSPTSITPNSGIVPITFSFYLNDPYWTNSGQTITCSGYLSVNTGTASTTSGGGGGTSAYWLIESVNNGGTEYATYDASYSVGDIVTSNAGSGDWEILSSGSTSGNILYSITGLSNTTTTTAAPTYYSVSVYGNQGGTLSTLCSGGYSSYIFYSTSTNPVGSQSIYTNSSLSSLAPAGWYYPSVGDLYRYWDGSSWGTLGDCKDTGGQQQ